MRILHAITGLGKAAGTTTFVENVVAGLRKLGHEVDILTIATDDGAWRQKQYDVVHLHALWTPWLHRVAKWARQNGTPVVWSTHGMTAPWSMRHKWWKKILAWWLYQKWDLKRSVAIHCTTDLEVEWNRKLGFKNCFVAPLGTNERCLNVTQSAFRKVKALDRKALAEKKIEEWLEGVTRESFCAALDKLVGDKVAAGEYRFNKESERLSAIAGAKEFFERFSHRIVQLSDGRCVYFVPDARARKRNPDNATSWAEYAFHAVSNGGARLPGKGYNVRLYNPHKAANFNLIEMTLKAERCYVRLDPDSRYDAIMFDGGVVSGLAFQVVARLDVCGNIEANLTEVTFTSSTKKAKKAPRLVALAEAVQAVVHHQTTPGSCPQDEDIISNHFMTCKGLKVLFVGRIYPVKGLVNLVKAAALIKQSNNLNNRTILFRLVGPDQAGHQAELMKLAEELGVADMFEWPGPKFGEELSAEYDNCDLLVLPSFTENFGGVVIDALAHGKPVIASKFTPWKILEDEGCGWWVSNDPEPLAAALVKAAEWGSRSHLCTSGEDAGRAAPIAGAIASLKEMGQQGHKLVEERYAWMAVCDKIVREYKEIQNGRA